MLGLLALQDPIFATRLVRRGAKYGGGFRAGHVPGVLPALNQLFAAQAGIKWLRRTLIIPAGINDNVRHYYR